MSIKRLQPLAKRFVNGAVARETKQADAYYLTPQHRAWCRYIVMRAGRRCEAIDGGLRCTKAWPQHRLFADHVVELQDGGAPLDPNNGQCLCSSHHNIKTMRERAKRHGRPAR
jgi:hypothetical protein